MQKLTCTFLVPAEVVSLHLLSAHPFTEMKIKTLNCSLLSAALCCTVTRHIVLAPTGGCNIKESR